MKTQNPFRYAVIEIDANGKVVAKLETVSVVDIDEKETEDSFLIDSLKRLLTAEYVSVYPESKKEEE